MRDSPALRTLCQEMTTEAVFRLTVGVDFDFVGILVGCACFFDPVLVKEASSIRCVGERPQKGRMKG